jgi:LysR family transcriptional regulator, hydrogen peroxide-inducible genes activator
MELHQLRYVAAVARTGNFSRAAEQCHVAQPSLSQQVKKLEEELGERLFDRTKRGARMTAHGVLLLRRAVKILEEADAAVREASEAKGLLRGTLTVGVLPTIAPYLLPKLLVAFTNAFPDVETVVHEDTTAQLLQQVLSYEIDLAVASQPIEDKRLEMRDLFSEELKLGLPPRHRLTKKRLVKLSDLHGEQLIVMKPGHCLGDQVLGFCGSEGVRPKVSFRSAQLETIQALVQAGAGLSLIPEMAVLKSRKPAPEYRSFAAPKPERKIVALWPKQRPLGRAAQEFLRLIPRRAMTSII